MAQWWNASTEAPVKGMMKTLQPGNKTVDDLAEWCTMTKGELQNDIILCFKTFDNIPDNVDHNWYFSLLNDLQYTQ